MLECQYINTCITAMLNQLHTCELVDKTIRNLVNVSTVKFTTNSDLACFTISNRELSIELLFLLSLQT